MYFFYSIIPRKRVTLLCNINMLIMEGFKFIPNDAIYVESAFVDASKSMCDIDFYRNIFKQDGKRLVYLPEVMRYAMPNVEFDERVLYDAVIKQSGLDIEGRGFIIVKEDGTLYFLDSNDNLDVYKEYLNNLIKISKNYKIISNNSYFDSERNMGNILIILSNNEIVIPNEFDFFEINYLI